MDNLDIWAKNTRVTVELLKEATYRNQLEKGLEPELQEAARLIKSLETSLYAYDLYKSFVEASR